MSLYEDFVWMIRYIAIGTCVVAALGIWIEFFVWFFGVSGYWIGVVSLLSVLIADVRINE